MLHRDGAASPEDQTPAEFRAKPEFPAPSALQERTQPPYPPARHPVRYEVPLSSRTLGTLSLAWPLHGPVRHGTPNTTFPRQQAALCWLRLPPSRRGSRAAPQDWRELPDLHAPLHPPSVLPQLSLILSSPAQCFQLTSAPPHLRPAAAPRGASPQ